VLKDTALPEAQPQLERERKELEEVRAQLSQAAERPGSLSKWAPLSRMPSPSSSSRERRSGERGTCFSSVMPRSLSFNGTSTPRESRVSLVLCPFVFSSCSFEA
jgi:hypothetical protein